MCSQRLPRRGTSREGAVLSALLHIMRRRGRQTGRGRHSSHAPPDPHGRFISAVWFAAGESMSDMKAHLGEASKTCIDMPRCVTLPARAEVQPGFRLPLRLAGREARVPNLIRNDHRNFVAI